MQLLKSTVGRKIVMAITGLLLLLFVIIHLIGNSTLYIGWLNAYAEHLHALPPVVWAFRLVMLTLFALHIFFGIQLTLENNAARPQTYAIKKNLKATFASKNMIWTGTLIGGFLIYHLLHFTAQITNPAISSQTNADALGRPDVFKMVVLSFQHLTISGIYICAMIALLLHLTHGVQSFVQTLGLNNDKTLPVMTAGGRLVAVILFLGYVAIPVVIVAGILRS